MKFKTLNIFAYTRFGRVYAYCGWKKQGIICLDDRRYVLPFEYEHGFMSKDFWVETNEVACQKHDAM